MTEQREQETRVVKAGDGPGRLLEDATATHVAAAAWIITAGAYGYGAASWPNGAYPDGAWVFLLLGIGIGVGISASIVAAGEGSE